MVIVLRFFSNDISYRNYLFIPLEGNESEMPNVIPMISNAVKILMEELYENRMLERSIKVNLGICYGLTSW